jgi:hypothetical protein
VRLREAHVAFDLADRPGAQRRGEVLAYPGPGVYSGCALGARPAPADAPPSTSSQRI